MIDKKEREGKTCFIITPIGNEDSDVFRKAKGVIESVIKPVLQNYGFDDIKPAYEINISGMINTQIINHIIEDDLVIANLTGNNPNVMYELCLRHVVAKPIIHICEKDTNLPFDIKDSRTIFYTNDMLGVDELKHKMSSFMDEIGYDKEYKDNPIYNACRLGNLLKENQGTEKGDIISILISMWNDISVLKNNYINIDGGNVGEEIALEYHSMREVLIDILNIDNRDIQKILKNPPKCKSKVYEVAKMLNTNSRLILYLASDIGAECRCGSSILRSEDVMKIIERIIKYQEEYSS